MSQALAKRTAVPVMLIPEERVLAMIEAAAVQLGKVETIPDSKQAVDIAEAIAAVTRKVKVAEETKRAAMRLLVDAESKLGELLSGLPHAGTHGTIRITPKARVLEENGINKRRASVAERLATIPRDRVDQIISSGVRTLHGVTSRLELHSNGYKLRADKASNMAALCKEAIDLLKRSVREGKVPHGGTVASLVNWYARITQHGNLDT